MISRADVVDVSISGLKLRVEEKIPVRTYIACNEPALGFSGRGSVRYCHFERGKFAVGIEFMGGTGWRVPKP